MVFCFKVLTMQERLPSIGWWSMFCYKFILKGEFSGYIFLINIICRIFFFSMKHVWLLCFHNYHTFGNCLILCFAILAIVHLEMSWLWQWNNLPRGELSPDHKGSNPLQQGVLHPTTITTPTQFSTIQSQH
jgi:hypothetical protein